MSLAVWSWVLTVVSIFGVWLTGRNPRAGWIFAVFNQQIWLTWALATGQWGFAVQSVAFSLVYARNLWRWRDGPPTSVGTPIAQPQASLAAGGLRLGTEQN